MTEREKMLAGEMYNPADAELVALRSAARRVCGAFSGSGPEAGALQPLRALFGSAGKDFYVEPTFRCDYGCHIHVGDNFYANFDCLILDVCEVTIGNNCMLAPRVGIFTATHPLQAEARCAGMEYGKPIALGNNVWVGAGALILPGVSVGHGAVVAAGAVVTKDVPPGVVVAGNPARVIRQIES